MPQTNEALQLEHRGEQILALAINLERELRGDQERLTAWRLAELLVELASERTSTRQH